MNVNKIENKLNNTYCISEIPKNPANQNDPRIKKIEDPSVTEYLRNGKSSETIINQ
jgi:hypothetical protein